MPPLADSPFPEGSYTELWDAIIRKAQNDPALSRVKTFQSWLGGPMQITPLTLTQLPALRITPAAGQFVWVDECRFGGEFVLRIRISVKGTDVSHLFNFWQAVAKALRPSQEFLATLVKLQSFNVTMSAPAFEPKLICDDQGIEAEGAIVFKTTVFI